MVKYGRQNIERRGRRVTNFVKHRRRACRSAVAGRRAMAPRQRQSPVGVSQRALSPLATLCCLPRGAYGARVYAGLTKTSLCLLERYHTQTTKSVTGYPMMC